MAGAAGTGAAAVELGAPGTAPFAPASAEAAAAAAADDDDDDNDAADACINEGGGCIKF
jgi:hypothetical protein